MFYLYMVKRDQDLTRLIDKWQKISSTLFIFINNVSFSIFVINLKIHKKLLTLNHYLAQYASLSISSCLYIPGQPVMPTQYELYTNLS